MEETMEETLEPQDTGAEEELSAGGLPSAVEDEQLSLDKFQITDDIKSKYFKNGKLQGRFDDIEGLILANKSVEDKYSSLMREIKAGKYQEVTTEGQSTVGSEVNVAEIAQPLVKQYIDNGMELTDDIIAEATSKGLDIRDVKLAAIELKEQINTAYNLVGGKEEYDSMLSWAKDALNDKQKKAFDKDLASNAGEWAIKGLYSAYKEANGTTATKQRIMGDGGATSGIKPYGSLQEVLRDKQYLDSMQGRHDKGAQAMYKKRMGMTPDSVLGV